jgi:integrase
LALESRRQAVLLSLGHDKLRLAQAVAAKIEADILAGHFDATLEAYRPKVAKPDDKPSQFLATGELWQRFMEHRRISGTSEFFINNRFRSLARNLARWGGEIDSEDAARQFVEYLRTRQSPTTANDNLRHLKAFGRWCVEQGHWPVNHFEKLKPAKVERAPKRDNPFTAEEVKLFLSTIKTDPHYYKYHDFSFCLFHLGCRPSELIGLRWGAVDFHRRQITIQSFLSLWGTVATFGKPICKTGRINYSLFLYYGVQ